MTVYAALDHRFRVACDHAGLRAQIATTLRSLRCEEAVEDATSYELLVDRDPPGPFELWADRERLISSTHPARPYARLLQQINRDANRLTSMTATVLHSAAATSRDGPILLPAHMESGKSTLVTALVRGGWAYLTDELIAVDPVTGGVRGYPRSISLDRGSWRLFPELAPNIDTSTRARLPAQWQIPPDSIGRLAPHGLPPEAVVLHGYEPERATRLVELDPVECLRRLISCCFSFDANVERDLAVLARTIDGAACFELTVGDLASAHDALVQAFGAPRNPAGRPT